MSFPDTFLDGTPWAVIPPPIDIPSLTALTILSIEFCMVNPSPRLTSILCHIPSIPMSTSITMGHAAWPNSDTDTEHAFQGRWVEIDRWLARLARHARVQGGLSVTFVRWPRGQSIWEGFLLEFRKAGGGFKMDIAATADDDDGLGDDDSLDDGDCWDDDGHWDVDGRWDDGFRDPYTCWSRLRSAGILSLRTLLDIFAPFIYACKHQLPAFECIFEFTNPFSLPSFAVYAR